MKLFGAMFTPKNMFQVLKPVFYTAKLFGLSPFDINSRCYKNSRINVCWSVIVATSLAISSITALLNRAKATRGLIMKITDILHTSLNTLIISVSIIFGCIFRHKIIKVISDLVQFDNDLKKLQIEHQLTKEYSKSLWMGLLGLFMALTFTISIAILDVLAFVDEMTLVSTGLVFVYVSPIFIMTFVELQFGLMLIFLRRRFHWLNQKLIEVGKNFDIKLQKNVKGNKIGPAVPPMMVSTFLQETILNTLIDIRIKYLELCSICQNLNVAYSLQLLFIIMESFFTAVATLFSNARDIISTKDYSIPPAMAAYSIYIIVFSVFQVVVLSTLCTATVKETRKTGTLLQNTFTTRLQFDDNILDLIDLEIMYFSLQLRCNKVEFTACKIFPIDGSLLFSIVGAMSTYLVIGIQFELATVANT